MCKSFYVIILFFLIAAKNTLIGPRRIFSNNNINSQNINAAMNSGFDLALLNTRNSYNQNFNTNPTSETSTVTNNSKLSKL